MGNPVRIIEYQEDKQRTPQEAVDYIKDEIASGNVKRMVIIFRDNKTLGYVSASDDRDYSKAGILWDITQWVRWFVG